MATPAPSRPRPEIWGGIEPTVRRVQDDYFDQLERGGHARRLTDLDLIAQLGIRRVRYPVLWERVAPEQAGEPDWSWPDRRLGRLRELGLEPIVGLLHHGSGPRHTNLLDPRFPEKLADYAASVAERYPWVRRYTPVNEPLTTARFSCLYGIWYPHASDDLSFARALLNECRAVVLAMRAVRQVNPEAQLVQTEDLGRTYATPRLAYQAELENERRWMTHDLLTGTLTRERRMWRWLREIGIGEGELDWFLDNPCPPDILGVNTYVTSERQLVEDLDAYPEQFHGGNHRERYADIEAVRVSSAGAYGHLGLLREAWARYARPLAITEVQLASTREEQLRWLDEAWRAALQLCSEGVDMRAVTAWALFGSFEWNSLLTQMQGHYESGAFDLRSPEPRWTAVATMLRSLAQTGTFEHPVLSVPGWWRRPERLLYPPVAPASDTVAGLPAFTPRAVQRRPLVITGATGTLGRALAHASQLRGLPHLLTSRQELDIADPRSVDRLLEDARPWAVVNAAGYVRVDEAESDGERCFRENAQGPRVLAGACAARGLQLLTFSSDLVFDGALRRPYIESDAVNPLSAYGASKAAGEQAVLTSLPAALVVRTSAFFSAYDEHNFVVQVLRALAAGQRFQATSEVVSPAYVPDLANVCLDLLIDGESGLWHVANEGACSWYELASAAAARAGLNTSHVSQVDASSLGRPAVRPAYSALGSERGWLMPSLEFALDRCVGELRSSGVVASGWRRTAPAASPRPGAGVASAR